MTKCNIFYLTNNFYLQFGIFKKGFDMFIMIKRAETMLEVLEMKLEKIANRFF